MPFTFNDPDTDSIASFRYLLVDFEAEDLEKYRPGGFHPVHLEDIYGNNRDKIVHKLDAGVFSTVWLARDELKDTWVALKIEITEALAVIESKDLVIRRAALSCK